MEVGNDSRIHCLVSREKDATSQGKIDVSILRTENPDISFAVSNSGGWRES